MFKVSNEKARGELSQSPSCQPVSQHFGRDNSGKSKVRIFFFLWLADRLCQRSHTSVIRFSRDPERPNSSQDAELGQALWDHTHLGSESGAPGGPTAAGAHQRVHLLRSTAEPSTSRAAGLLLRETSVGNSQLCLCVCKEATKAQSTTAPIGWLSRNVSPTVTLPIRSFKGFASRMAEWIKPNNPQQHLAWKKLQRHHRWK